VLPEHAIEKYLCRKVKERGGMCVKLTGFNGIPDRLVIGSGDCWFIELKAEDGVLSPIQQAIHRRLKSMNQKVFVVNSFEMVDRFVVWAFGVGCENGIT